MKKLYLFIGSLLLAASVNLSQAQKPMTEVKIGDLVYISHTGTGRVWTGTDEASNIQIRDPKIAFNDTAQIWEVLPAQVAGNDSLLNDADFFYLREKTGLERFASSEGVWNSRVNAYVGAMMDTTRYYWTFVPSTTAENVFHIANGNYFVIDSSTWTVQSVSNYMGPDATGNASSLYTDKATSNAGASFYVFDARTYAKVVISKAVSEAESLITLLNDNDLNAYGDTLQTALDAVKQIDDTKTYDQYTLDDQAKLDELQAVSGIKAIADVKTWQTTLISFQNKIAEAEGKAVLDSKYPAGLADSLNIAIAAAKAYEGVLSYQSSTVDEIKAEQSILQGFMDRMSSMLKIVDKLIAKIEEAKAVDQEAAAYPDQSKADFNAAITAAESYLAGIKGTTASADIEQATAELNLQMYSLLISVADKENPIEVTDLISDPSFEESSGFTLSSKWKDASVVSNGDRRVNSTIVVPDGKQCWNSWSNNFSSMNVYQDLTMLPNGVYRVNCQAITQEDFLTDQHLYATTFETTESDVLTATEFNTTVEAWETLSTEFVVFDGTARIGFASTSGGAQAGWFCIDNFRLYYLGLDPDAVEAMFRVLLNQIQTDRMDYVVPLGEDPKLDAALDEANAFREGEYTHEELGAMITKTNAAWKRFKDAQTTALALNDYIIEATEMYETADETVYSEDAFIALIDAINLASEILGDGASLMEDCEQAFVDLKQAVRAFKYSAVGSEDNPADFSFAIVNPELNTSSNSTVPQGWTAAHENGNGYMGHIQHYRGDGYYYFDSWNGTAGALKFKAYQNIAGLPQGTYTLKMAGRATNNGDVAGKNGVQIYAKAGTRLYSTSVPCEGAGNLGTADAIPGNFKTAIFHEDGVTWYGWNDISVQFIHVYDGDQLEIGVDVNYLDTFTGTWFSACEPRLYYLGPDFKVFKEVYTNKDIIVSGKNFSIPIQTIPFAAEKSVHSYQFDFAYDTTIVEYLGFDQANTLSENSTVLVNDTHKGLLKFGGMTQDFYQGDLPLIDLRFKAIKAGYFIPQISNFLFNADSVHHVFSDTIFVFTKYGDVDGNNYIQAYDASLVLKKSVGLDPLPDIDPLPWEGWRMVAADVDGDEAITAYDAALILKKSIDLLDIFPVENDNPIGMTRAAGLNFADISIHKEADNLVVRSIGNMLGLNMDVIQGNEYLAAPSFYAHDFINAENLQGGNYKIGLATATALEDNSILMIIPLKNEMPVEMSFRFWVNTTPKTITMLVPSGLSDELIPEVKVFPNPAKDKINIKLGMNPIERMRYKIIHLSGQTIQEGVLHNQTSVINLSNAAAGVYSIQILDKNKVVYLQKLIVK